MAFLFKSNVVELYEGVTRVLIALNIEPMLSGKHGIYFLFSFIHLSFYRRHLAKIKIARLLLI